MAKSNKPKLTYIFHNPNSDDDLANYLIKLFVKINYKKLEDAIIKEMNTEMKEKGKPTNG